MRGEDALLSVAAGQTQSAWKVSALQTIHQQIPAGLMDKDSIIHNVTFRFCRIVREGEPCSNQIQDGLGQQELSGKIAAQRKEKCVKKV